MEGKAVRPLLYFVLLIGLVAIRWTYPFFLGVLPTLFVLRFFPATSWERWAALPTVATALVSTAVYALASCHLYRPELFWGFLLAANAFSVYKFRPTWKRLFLIHGSSLSSMPVSAKVSVIALMCVWGGYFLYSMLFPFISHAAGPYPAFAQMGQWIARTGSFHLMTATEAAYDTTVFYYTPAFSGVLAWIASATPTSLAITETTSYLPPLLLASASLMVIATGARVGRTFLIQAFLLSCVFVSYSLFRIGTEIDSDTLTFSWSALGFYLMVRLTQSRSVRVEQRLWLGLFGVLFFSWWIRMHLGLFFLISLIGLLLGSSQARLSFSSVFKGSTTRRILRCAVLLALVVVGPFWQLLLWKHTGSPIAPRSITPLGWQGMAIDPKFAYYVPPADPPTTSVSKPSKWRATRDQAIYDFTALVEMDGQWVGWGKRVRGLLHGNLFSGFFSFLLLIGLITVLRRRMRLWSADGAALVFGGAILFVMAGTSYFSKMLFAAIPIFIHVAGLALTRLREKHHAWDSLFSAGTVCFAALFWVSLAWSGVGSWPADRRWGFFRIAWQDISSREWLKNGDQLEPALAFLGNRPKEERFLYFHPEPGHALSFYADRRPFWQEFHYDSHRLDSLHQAEDPETVLQQLRALGIEHVITSYDLEHYRQYSQGEWLPKLILQKDPRLTLEAQSTGGIYHVYRISEGRDTIRPHGFHDAPKR